MGILDTATNFFTGGGEYADPNALDPVYNVPKSMVRDAQWNTIGNISATLLAAGMRMTPAQRAQILMQGLSNAGSRQTADLYNAQQVRYQQAQMRDKEEERKQRAAAVRAMKENPSAFGLTAEQAAILSDGLAMDIVKTRLARDPQEQELTRLKIEEAKRSAEREKKAGELLRERFQPAPAASPPAPVMPVAPAPAMPPAAEGVAAPAAAPAEAAPVAAAALQPYRLPNQTVQGLMAAGTKATDILELEAKEALKQDGGWEPVRPGDNAIRKELGVPPSQPLVVKRNASGRVVDFKTLGEDSNKAIPAELAARVGLAKAVEPLLTDIDAAVDAGKFDLTNVANRAALAAGVGEMGGYSRRMEMAKDALIRHLTGAGMATAEAEAYARRYSIQAGDSPATIKDKVRLLRWALENIEVNVGRGRGEISGSKSAPPPAPGAAPSRADLEAEMRRRGLKQ